ncbi:MAG: hypothetical protein A2255_04570 [Candidatus Melainabacteria bacterium RIFOXYA2_FULL_32_9]|nr:MAG: hypothetical protein A2255_04570 [Candidatus Melainabacteria bacterium RIFOXYA2_FULL_32_9]
MINFLRKTHIKKVLIFRFGAIGDVVHSTALYRSLKKYDQNLSIHYLTGKVPSLLLENDTYLDKIWITEGKSYKDLAKLAKELKKEKFDLCINLQPSIRTRIFSFLVGSKLILTYNKTFKIHAVKNFWITAKPLFRDILLDKEINIFIPEETKEKISKILNTEKKIIGFNMGSNSARQGRKWPIEHWKELAKRIIDKYDCEIVLTGSLEDREISETLLDISPKIKSFCGKLNILENAALLSRCNILISGDTGPLHIATAVKTPVIGLYGSMPVLRTGPYGESNSVLFSDRNCIPCNRRKCKLTKKQELYTPCMEDITPDKVFNIIEKYLDN